MHQGQTSRKQPVLGFKGLRAQGSGFRFQGLGFRV